MSVSKPFDVNEIMGSIDVEIRGEMREAGLKVLATVVAATPVDTGHAKANWQTTVGETTDQELDAVDPSGGATIADGAAAIGAYPKSGERPPIHVQNNAPYIARLDDGWSHQAPAGFVEKAVDVAVNDVARERKELE